MKILVADDDPVSRRLMEGVLQHSGYEVFTADNGRQAAHELSRVGGPRLALVDWMMPELDGPGVCREVRARNEDGYVYIVLLTSRDATGDIVVGLEAGADDYLTKPCRPAELKARLHTGRRILQLEDKLVRAREEMRFRATHDALTALWNRDAILSLLQSELGRSARENFSLSLLLCDVDHFKAINDEYGHLEGDQVLRQVSVRLLDAIRETDAVGRYGGEEFLIILRSCDGGTLKERAEQVRRAINGSPFPTNHGSIRVSLSIGVHSVEDWDESISIESLLKKADAALYEAKAAGRDRVVYGVASRDERLKTLLAVGEQSSGWLR
jgi:two-component system cell cycle response regulator